MVVRAVDNNFAMLHRVSARSEKSFTSINWLILACMALMSDSGELTLGLPNTSAAGDWDEAMVSLKPLPFFRGHLFI